MSKRDGERRERREINLTLTAVSTSKGGGFLNELQQLVS